MISAPSRMEKGQSATNNVLKMPYIGLTGSYRYEDFELGGTFKYSGWVESSDNDEHYDPGKKNHLSQ